MPRLEAALLAVSGSLAVTIDPFCPGHPGLSDHRGCRIPGLSEGVFLMAISRRAIPGLAVGVAALLAFVAPAVAAGTSTSTTTTNSVDTSTTPPPGHVLSTEFEDGTLQGWKPLGGTTLSLVTDSLGNHRLRISGITGPGQGAALDVDTAALTPGTSYIAHGFGRLPAGEGPGVFELRAVSAVRDAPVAQALFDNSWAWLGTDLTWAATPSGLQLQMVADHACPGQPLPAEVDFDDLVLFAGSPSADVATGCPTTTSSTSSTSSSTSTTSSPAAACSASYHLDAHWPGGYQASVTVRAGSAALTGWVVGWTFPADESIVSAWNATVRSTGSAVTATDAGYNGRLAPGGTAKFGFIGQSSNLPAAPVLSCRPR